MAKNNTAQARTYHLSVREIADWGDCPCTAMPVTLAQAKELSSFYECKLWLQTKKEEYLGTVVEGRVYNKTADKEIVWGESLWGKPVAKRLA